MEDEQRAEKYNKLIEDMQGLTNMEVIYFCEQVKHKILTGE